jgi:hypothetical protein
MDMVAQAPDKIAQLSTVVDQVNAFAKSMQGFEGLSFDFTPDGKYKASIRKKDDTSIPVNQTQSLAKVGSLELGTVTVKTIDIGKELSFKAGKQGDNITLEDIQGIRANASVGVDRFNLKKDVSVDVKTATFSNNDGKPSLNVDIALPDYPDKRITIPVPLDKMQ